MRRALTLIAALALTLGAWAQTLSVEVGGVTYLFPAAQAGEMAYADGSALTVMGRTFALADVTAMKVDETDVTDNLVSIAYDGASASVAVAGNVAQYVNATVSGAHVTIEQGNTAAVDGDEITYQLTGSTSDGSLTLGGAYKCTVSLAGLTLTNPLGAAINVTNSKRIQLSAKKGTVNTLTDGASGAQKACIYSKGQLQLQGGGTLSVAGLAKHAIKSASYVTVKNLTLNVTSAVGDGINCEEYLLVKSGAVTIAGVGGDGLQCDLGGNASTGATADHDDEDSGNIYVEGGTLSVTVPRSATAGRCVRSDGDILLMGGTLTLSAGGDIDLSDTSDPSYTAGLKADGRVSLAGADVTIDVTGAAGRGVAAATFVSRSGSLTVTDSGALSSSGTAYYCTAKGIKATTVDIEGGTLSVTTSGNASKGIKSDGGSMTIAGGTLDVTTTGGGAYDATEADAKGCAALKSDGALTVTGGTLTLRSTGTGGKCIKADGTLDIAGGTVSATSTGAQYRYSSRLTASAKAIKSGGAMTISDGTVTVSSASHEGIETKGTLSITGGYVYASASDDAINSASTMTIAGGHVMASSSGNDGLDANGNLYIKGGDVVAVAASDPEVGIDANTEGGYSLYITGGNVVAIGGFERGASITGGTAKSASYTKGAWYGLTNADTAAFAFKVPSNGSMGSTMAVYTTGTPALASGVTAGGTSFWSGNGASAFSGGSSVSLSTYSNSGGTPGGGTPGGGGPGGGPGGHR